MAPDLPILTLVLPSADVRQQLHRACAGRTAPCCLRACNCMSFPIAWH